MAKYDVHRLSSGTMVVDCQSDYIRGFDTRIVIPLLAEGPDRSPVTRLEPLLKVGDESLILVTHLLAAVPRFELGRNVDSLIVYRDEIDRAVDLLISGF